MPGKNLLHTYWYLFTFGVKDAVISPDPVLFLESMEYGELASVTNTAVWCMREHIKSELNIFFSHANTQEIISMVVQN